MCTLVGTAVSLGSDALNKKKFSSTSDSRNFSQKNIRAFSNTRTASSSAYRKMNTEAKVTTALAVTSEGLSLTRDIASLIPSIGPTNPVVHSLGYATGGLGLILGGAVTVRGGITDLRKSHRIGDSEGEERAKMSIAAGIGSSSASGLFLARTALGPGVLGLGLAMNVLSALVACIKIGTWGFFGYHSHNFGSELSRIADMKDEQESKRLLDGIRFLQGKIAPTQEEREAIRAISEKRFGHLSSKTKEFLNHKKLLDLTKTKIECLKRRVGIQAIREIALNSERLFTQLQLSPNHLPYQKEARNLIQEVQQSNRKQTRLYAAAALVTTVVLAGLIAGIAFSLIMLSCSLSALVAAGGLLVAVAPLIRKTEVMKEDLAKIAVDIGRK